MANAPLHDCGAAPRTAPRYAVPRACYELRDMFYPVDADPSKLMAPDLLSLSVGAKGAAHRPIVG
ncbi:MAG: hypothetical protein M3Q10_15590, partial [Chloroflexota bacterium]|nr:hypothetical protein [Chloroflexota bacterium]